MGMPFHDFQLGLHPRLHERLVHHDALLKRGRLVPVPVKQKDRGVVPCSGAISLGGDEEGWGVAEEVQLAVAGKDAPATRGQGGEGMRI